ncbi:MAG: 4-oxalomesaconate tautomerase [Alphaproteobacteria bacterium]|nr:4-oxalomesaconate tautomerase [Alphaproteobacteria bacterium]
MKSIPSVMMRGGTSRGLYFRSEDLPSDRNEIANILLSAMGSYDPTQIDGVGGATSLTSKVAIVGPSIEPGIDIDYLFAQVGTREAVVDFGPTCGNMLAGVGPFAIEAGMIAVTEDETKIRIRSANTDAIIEASIQTPNGNVLYEGSTAIDGVPGTAAPIVLNFQDAIGSKSGALFPTGKHKETIDGVEVSLVDATMPAMILRAKDIGKTGYETATELDDDRIMFARLEAMRREAGRRMGLGDVSDSVVPKIMIVAPPQNEGTITSRYLVPDRTHAAHAVTGAVTLAHCVATYGTVADEIAKTPEQLPTEIKIEHPSGNLVILLGQETAGLVRTARRLFAGEVFVTERSNHNRKAA